MSSKTATSASSSSTTSARCAHFGACGGCQLQNLSYEEQLNSKRDRVQRLLGPLGVELGAAHASPQTWFYRNKMEFSFGDVYPPVEGVPPLRLGLKPRGKWFEILDLQECYLLSPETPALLAAARKWALENKVPPYISKKNSGLLRHLVVREGKNTGERLVLLVTSPGDIPAASFVEAVRGAYPATTVIWGVNGKVSDTAISDKLGALFGPGSITETLTVAGRTLRFRISPQAFFQTNTKGAELLYNLIAAKVGRPRAALDLFCGGGGIALSLAASCGKVYGAELNASAIEDAKANAVLNGIPNAQFFAGEVQTLLPSMLALGCEVAVVDPPRAGLHPSALQPLLEKGPERLVYVSCNPEALARDLAKLAPSYRATSAELVDLFPHTEHVETIVELSRA